MVSVTENTRLSGHSDQRSIYDSIRNRLAAGELVPGKKLKPEELRRDYGCSASMLREVLFRLACSGYIDFEEQRGFRVPLSSLERLSDIVHMRVLIESEAAALSIARGDMEWEARLNAAHHKLAHLEAKMHQTDQLREHIPIWTRFDWEFHETLSSACGSQLLQETLHSIFYRYRQQLVGLVQDHGFRKGTVEEHKAILDAALARDPAGCIEAIRAHFTFIDNLQLASATQE
ncbi:MAG TPA: GntR family transcriptional regulator [Hyphomicrobiales bacterium]|nr:GntR family transcriptional regulator [Hyphomicrobiales bacterium]